MKRSPTMARGPASSQRKLAELLADDTIYNNVLRKCMYAASQGMKFTDGWLARETGYARNITARVRLEVERDGWVERVPGRQLLTFEVPTAMLKLWQMSTKVVDRGGRGPSPVNDEEGP